MMNGVRATGVFRTPCKAPTTSRPFSRSLKSRRWTMSSVTPGRRLTTTISRCWTPSASNTGTMPSCSGMPACRTSSTAYRAGAAWNRWSWMWPCVTRSGWPSSTGAWTSGTSGPARDSRPLTARWISSPLAKIPATRTAACSHPGISTRCSVPAWRSSTIWPMNLGPGP